jgi:hypothetical protein
MRVRHNFSLYLAQAENMASVTTATSCSGVDSSRMEADTNKLVICFSRYISQELTGLSILPGAAIKLPQ